MSVGKSSRAAVRERDGDRTVDWMALSVVVAACLFSLASRSYAAVGGAESALAPTDTAIITGSIQPDLSETVDVQMKFVQVDGPEAGHVKVVLTPDDRPLTLDAARSAARQAFLETLNDPFFADDLKIVTVVVHRFPGQDDPTLDFSVRFSAKGEGRWSIQDMPQ